MVGGMPLAFMQEDCLVCLSTFKNHTWLYIISIPPTTESYGKAMFSVCLSVHRGEGVPQSLVPGSFPGREYLLVLSLVLSKVLAQVLLGGEVPQPGQGVPPHHSQDQDRNNLSKTEHTTDRIHCRWYASGDDAGGLSCVGKEARLHRYWALNLHVLIWLDVGEALHVCFCTHTPLF